MMPHPENHVEDIMGCTDGRGLFAAWWRIWRRRPEDLSRAWRRSNVSRYAVRAGTARRAPPREARRGPDLFAVIILFDRGPFGGSTTQGCFDMVKMWMSGGSASGCRACPLARSGRRRRTPRSCSTPRSGNWGSARSSGPCRWRRRDRPSRARRRVSSTRSASIMALRAKAAPVSRWHQRQWQQCTNSGRAVMR